MSPDRLLKHFETISDTEDAVPRLRRFIIDLAIRGKLLVQDPNDEPASELLKGVQAKKAKLIKHGEIKKEKPTFSVNEAEVPFKLPASWVWERLYNLTSYIQRGKSPQYSNGDGLPVISQKCVQWDGLHLEFAKKITRSSLKGYEPIRYLRDGDLLWNSTGTGTIGRIIRVNKPAEKLVCDSHVTIVRCLLINEGFVRLWLSSDHVYGVIEDRASGTTNQVELTAAIANSQITPVPPLSEQHRIVTKVDELMSLCDELEVVRTKRETRRDYLVATTLHRLNKGNASLEAGNDTDFKQTARFYFNHLPRLTTRLEHIKHLRESILNSAFCGKLVPQQRDEGTGRELLQRVSDIRIKTHQSQGRQRSPQIDRDPSSCPGVFNVPASWTWSYLDFLCEQIGDVDHKMPKAVTKGVPFISAKDLKDDGTIDFNNPKMISEDDYRRLSRKIKMQRDDIVYSRIGAKLGKARLVQVDTRFLISYSCCLVRPLNAFVDKHYIQQFLDSSLALNQAHKGTQSIGVPDLGLGEIKAFRVPLPPLAEQRRIVAKVDELMALCDELEGQLTTTATNRRQLLEATLREVLHVPQLA